VGGLEDRVPRLVVDVAARGDPDPVSPDKRDRHLIGYFELSVLGARLTRLFSHFKPLNIALSYASL